MLMDDATSTTDAVSDDWESALIAKARDVPAHDESSDEDQIEHPPVLTNKEALGHVSELVNYATHTHTHSRKQAMLEAVLTVQSLMQDHCIKQAAYAKQESITDLLLFSEMWGHGGDEGLGPSKSRQA